jgi:hypothetical protein
LKAFGRTYAGWGFSQSFYREELFRTVLGFKDLEDFLQNFWETWALSKGMTISTNMIHKLTVIDPENLLAMLYTWQSGLYSLTMIYCSTTLETYLENS